ncbi:ABC transporter substrate-binding protein [Zymobacter sp. IVIA_5232.4 C2]|uniref:ABC transporter substrate-binding protein n=1 Tax=Zymobacter sp. IVIA_5232.4 C2 TaxID=3394855 RepID=UPI0039C1BC91
MKRNMSRRALLKAGGLGVGGLLLPGSLLAAGEMPSGTAPRARRGGVLRAAFAGRAGTPMNVLQATRSPLDYVRARLVWDALADTDDGHIDYRLMTSAVSDRAATRWRLTIRRGVTFSDGRPLTAHDVLYSLHVLASNPCTQSGWLAPLDTAASRIDDDYTLTLALKQPIGAFDWRLAQGMFVFPADTRDLDHALGTGAWTLTSSSDSVNTFSPRSDYWDSERGPLLDRIQLYGIMDMNARVNGLKAGQFDYVGGVALTSGLTEQHNPNVKVVTAPPALWDSLMFSMNLSKPPFDSPDVCEALKLSIDREAMVRTLSFGKGDVANDTLGQGQPWHNSTLPQRHYDPERAQALLKKAGVSPRLSILTSNYAWGLAESATLMLRQAKPAGFTLSLNKLPAADYYSDLNALFDAPLKTNYFHPMPLPVALPFYYGRHAPYPFTGPSSPKLDALIQTLQAAQGEALVTAVHDVQEELYFHGGDAIFMRIPSIALSSPRVNGVEAAGYFDYPTLRSAWLAD